MLTFNLAACAKTGSGASRQATLVIASGQEPSSLNPLYLQGAIGYAISELGYSYLTNYDSRGNIVPDVAVAVPSIANGGISAMASALPTIYAATFHGKMVLRSIREILSSPTAQS